MQTSPKQFPHKICHREENVLQEIFRKQKLLYLITRYFNGLVRMASVIERGEWETREL